MNLSPEARQWADCVEVFDRLRTDPPLINALPHPATAVPNLLQATFRPSSPREIFSDHRPTYSPLPSEEDLIPIDILLGLYDPAKREITIFIKSIDYYAHTVFRCPPDDLTHVVRLHEYGHAIVHLGLLHPDDSKKLRTYPQGQQTNWHSFDTERDTLFSSLDESTHECLAQLITWLTLSSPPEAFGSAALRNLFAQLMQRQRQVCRIEQAVLDNITVGSFRMAMRWFWDSERWPPPDDLPLAHAVMALSLQLSSERAV